MKVECPPHQTRTIRFFRPGKAESSLTWRNLKYHKLGPYWPLKSKSPLSPIHLLAKTMTLCKPRCGQHDGAKQPATDKATSARNPSHGARCHHPLRLCLAKTTKVTHWWSQKSQKQPKKKNTCSLCFPNMFFFSKNNDFWFTNWSYASPQTPKCSYPGANPRRQRGEHHGPVDHLEDRELQPWWPKFRRGGKIIGKRRALYEGSVVTWFPKPAGLFHGNLFSGTLHLFLGILFGNQRQQLTSGQLEG